MAKCELCEEKKGRRDCPAIGKKICPTCCATKRVKEIDCPANCEYLRMGQDFKARKDIEKEVRSGLYAMDKDISKNESVLSFISNIEFFLAKEFYENMSVNDHKIYNALSKIYVSFSDNAHKEIKYDGQYEEIIINKFFEVEKKYTDLDTLLKKDVIIRILDNIKKETGGTYSDNGYLRSIHIKNDGEVYF